MKIYLYFTNRARYNLGAASLMLSGICGQLSDGGSLPTIKLRKLKSMLANKACLLKNENSRDAAIFTNLETACMALDAIISEIGLHKIFLDRPCCDCLRHLSIAFSKLSDFIASPRSASALMQAGYSNTEADHLIKINMRAANHNLEDFIGNLKFSRIYSGLMLVVNAVSDNLALLKKEEL